MNIHHQLGREKKNDGQPFRSVLQNCTHPILCVFFGGAIDIHNTDSRSGQP